MQKLYSTQRILKEYHDDLDFLHVLSELFIDQMPQMAAELQKASKKKDWYNIHFYAHKLKASIDLFLIEPLTELIRKLEHQGLNKIESKTLEKDAGYVVEIITECVVQLKKDFAK